MGVADRTNGCARAARYDHRVVLRLLEQHFPAGRVWRDVERSGTRTLAQLVYVGWVDVEVLLLREEHIEHEVFHDVQLKANRAKQLDDLVDKREPTAVLPRSQTCSSALWIEAEVDVGQVRPREDSTRA